MFGHAGHILGNETQNINVDGVGQRLLAVAISILGLGLVCWGFV